MEAFVKVAKVGELASGEMKYVEVEGEEVLLANIGGTHYAVNDTCTHAQGSLSDGVLEGEQVDCPLHGSVFNVATGAVVEGPADEPLPRYAVRVEGEDILIGPA